ncbi:MAG: substrate-binding domain-containing protein, partial [Anaerolineae bacterium]|nr:substrate-binding domain-containing protein [Anaerolineae bacterium]
MVKMRFLPLIFLLLIAACTPMPLVDAPPQIVTIHATSATEEWLPLLYDCAAQTPGLLLSRTLDIASADMSLHLTAPNIPDAIIYKIGDIEMIVVGNAANPVSSLSDSQLGDIYEGKINNWLQVGGTDEDIQLWIYAQDSDLQLALSETLLRGRTLSSLARQASKEKMVIQAISKDVSAVGIISSSQESDEFGVLQSLGKYPVLIVAK